MVKTEDNFWRTSLNQKVIMKDLNFLEISKQMNEKLIEFNQEDRAYLQQILKSDSKFLADHNLMDYSLLLTIEQSNSKKCNI
jgi:hypothetical protein